MRERTSPDDASERRALMTTVCVCVLCDSSSRDSCEDGGSGISIEMNSDDWLGKSVASWDS